MIRSKTEFISRKEELPPLQKEVEILKDDGETVIGYFCYSWPGNDSGVKHKRWVGPSGHIIPLSQVYGWRELQIEKPAGYSY